MNECFNFEILGIKIYFPYEQVYPSQKALIANSIRSFKNQENALLESPTGTGKGLSLLAASLAYQRYIIDNQINFGSLQRTSLIQANDTFSIFSKPISVENTDSSTKPLQFKFEAPRIWLTSRTHQQLKQLINEYKRLPYNPPMVILAGRKKLCLNGKVLKSADMSTECRKLIESNKCPFKMEAGIPKEFRPGGKCEKFDIEDMIEYGRKHFRCPYHMSLVILSKADLVFCPYNYVINPRIKGLLELSLLNSILVVDEAHNIENVCRESGTFRITHTDFAITMKSLENLKSEIVIEDSDHKNVIIIQTFLEAIDKWFNEKINLLRFMNKKETILEVSNVFEEWNLTFPNWLFYQEVFKRIITKKTVVDNSENGTNFENLILLESLFIFFVLAFQNNMDNFNKFKIVVMTDPKKDESSDCILISCLDPSVIFKCVSREVHSIVLSSGTLSPLSTFSSELGTNFSIQLSANHIIDKDQVQSYIITQGIDGSPFNSNYQYLLSNKANVIECLGQMFLALLPVIPGGVLFFLPSYKFLNDLVDLWKKCSIWNSINKIKKIFTEDSRSINETFENYQQTINKKLGGFLIGVCRGNMSEGMDFRDEQARAVFVFGIPYPAYQDIEIRLKRSYNDQLCPSSPPSSQSFSDNIKMNIDSPSHSQDNLSISKNVQCKHISGSEWYEAQAFRSVFQAVGRCIRHKNDYGSIFLIDQRFKNFIPKFPRWVQMSFIEHKGIMDIRQKLGDFFRNMQIKFPRIVLFNRGQKVVFECSKCKTIVIDIPSIDFDRSIQTSRLGFLNLVEAGIDNNCIFISRNSKFKLFAPICLNENIWSQEDLSIYNLIICPKCGLKLGVRILGTTSQDSIYMEGMLFLLSHICLHEEEVENNNTNTKEPKKKKKVNSPSIDKSQKKLFLL